MDRFRYRLAVRSSKQKKYGDNPEVKVEEPSEKEYGTEESAALESRSAAVTVTGSNDLWDTALERLRDKNSKLVDEYEASLRRERQAHLWNTASSAAIGPPPSSGSELPITNDKEKLELAQFAKSRFEKIKNERARSAKFEAVLKVVVQAKDFLSAVASTDLHGAVAWAGVSVLLPLFLNPTQQHATLLEGIEKIPEIINRYKIYESITYLHTGDEVEDNQTKEDARKSLQDLVIELYAAVLEYQARAICHTSRFSIHKYARDVFKKDDWVAILQNIDACDRRGKDLIDVLGIEHSNSTLSQQSRQLDLVLSEINALNQKGESEEIQRCHQTFFCDYTAQKARNPDRVPGTCLWFLQNETFINWKYTTETPLLWVSADPGCGKSVLSKSVIDEQLLGADLIDCNVCYFFFKDNSPENRSAETALASLIHQILSWDFELTRHVLPEYRRSGAKITQTFQNMSSVFQELIKDTKSGNVICLLDAFDECEQEGRMKLVSLLASLFGECSNKPASSKPHLKVLITSRPYVEIGRNFTDLLACQSMIELKGSRESEQISQEIELVIRERIPQVATKLDLPEPLKDQLLSSFLEVPNKTYLWLHLMIENLETSVGVRTSKKLQSFLQKLPQTIFDAYDDILNRISLEKRHEALKLLQIVVAAVRPLSLRELNIAREIQGDEESLRDLDLEDDEDFELTAINLCGLFITVVDSRVTLIHQTAREFLIGVPGYVQSGSSWKHCIDPTASHHILASACLDYLRLFKSEAMFNWKSPYGFKSSPVSGLVQYAVDFWGVHVKEAKELNLQDRLISILSSPYLAIGLGLGIARFKRIDYRTTLDDNNSLLKSYYLRTPSNPSLDAFHLLAHFDLAQSMENYMSWCKFESKSIDIDAQSDRDSTPLIIASRRGNLSAVQWLLKQGANPSLRDTNGRSALGEAFSRRKSATTKLLLLNGARFDSYTDCQLAFASELLESEDLNLIDVVLDFEVRFDGTEYCSIVMDLLDKALPRMEDFRFQTWLNKALFQVSLEGALSLAVKYQELGNVQYWLEKGAKPEFNDFAPIQPIAVAADRGNISILECLLESGAGINKKDLCGRTPLYISFESGNPNLSIYLLANGAAINSDDAIELRDISGHFVIGDATQTGNIDSLKLLFAVLRQTVTNLDESVCNVLRRDMATAVRIAASFNDQNVFDCFLHDGIYPEFAIVTAGEMGWTDTLRMWKERGESIDVLNEINHTPLCKAAENGFKDTVLWLLENGANPDGINPMAGTPLELAIVHRGGLEIVKCLLEHGANPNVPSPDVPPLRNYTHSSRSPLLTAIKKNLISIVPWLLEYGADPNTQKSTKWSEPALSIAISLGHEEIVQCLLEYGADPNLAAGDDGQTAVYVATRVGNERVLRMLLDRGADPNIASHRGITPYLRAKRRRQRNILQILEEYGVVGASQEPGMLKSPHLVKPQG